MKINEIFTYLSGKKQPNVETAVDLTKIGIELRELMEEEYSERLTAIFLHSYSDVYKVLPSDKMLNLTFRIDDDLEMVAKMLIEGAKAKHQQVVMRNLEKDNVEEPSNVMLYDTDTKELVGGLSVQQKGNDEIVCVINERKRQLKKQDDVM